MSTETQTSTESLDTSHVGDLYRSRYGASRGRWKGSCLTCDYWTGYVSERQATKSLKQHLDAHKITEPTA